MASPVPDPIIPLPPPHVLALVAGGFIALLGAIDIEWVRHIPQGVDLGLITGGVSLIAGVAIPSPFDRSP